MNSSFQYYEESFMTHGSLSVVMGTRFDLVLLGKSKSVSELIWKRVTDELQRLDKMLNRFDSQSEISQINANAFQNPVVIKEEMWNILIKCKEYFNKTKGLFDVTLKDFSKVVMDEKNRTIEFLSADLSLDLGGYAKGYALESTKAILNESEVDQAFLNFGNSSILGIGHHPYGDSWKVNIMNPYHTEEVLGVIDLIDNSLSTSGNSTIYSNHIFNPVTGETNNEKKVVSVISDNAAEAEVLSTTMMIASEADQNLILELFDNIKFKIFNA